MTAPELIALAESLATCTHDLRELARKLPDDDGVVAAALHLCAQDRLGGAFQRLLLAAMEGGRDVPASVLACGASLLPDMRALATASRRCTGDVASALVDAARDGRLADWDAYALYIAVWWAQHQTPPADFDRVLREARAASRRQLTPEAQQVFSALARLSGDRDLKVVLRTEGHLLPERDAAATVRDLETWFSAPPLLDLPAKPPPLAVTTAPATSTKVGRNEACPCGSGLKHKKCCWGKTTTTTGSPPALTEQRLLSLTGWELCRLGVDDVPEPLQELWLNQLMLAAEYDRAAAILVTLGSAGRESLVADALRWATALRRAEAVRLLAPLVDPSELSGGVRLLQHQGDPAAQLAEAEAQALALLDDRTGELAFNLVDGGLTGLALHVARGALALAGDDDLAPLLQVVLQVRDRAGVDPLDPIEERVLPWIQGGRRVEDSGLAAALEDKSQDVERLRQELARVHAAFKTEREQLLAQAQAAPAPEPVGPEVDPQLVRDLRTKVAALVDELKLRTAERAELRSEVARAEEALELAATQPQAPAIQAPDEPQDTGPGGPHPVRIPVVPDTVAATLETLPDPVRRQALELLGRLAAGREDAFRGSRPLRGRSWLWRQRVGRSYRMFFTLADDRLEVVDVIHRQDLEKRIRELS